MSYRLMICIFVLAQSSLCLAQQAKADYSECATFLSKLHFLAGPAGGHFQLLSDGSIKSGKDFSYKRDGNRETISVPAREWLPGSAYDLVFVRSDKGDLQSFSVVKFPTEERIKGEFDSGDDGGIFANLGYELQNTWQFEVRDGSCVPTREISRMIREPKLSAKKTDVIATDTALCRELEEFFNKKPELKACLDEAARNALIDIFKKRLSEDSHTYPYAFGLYGGQGLELIKTSPFMRAGMEMRLCESKGLKPFTSNDALWKKAVPQTTTETKDKSKSEASAAKP